MVAFVSCIAALILSGDVFFIPADGDTVQRIGRFERARAIAVDPAGDVYVLDAGRSEVKRYSQSGDEKVHVGGYGWDDQAFQDPLDLCTPNHLDVYVADYGNHRIQRFDRNLNFVSSLSLRENNDPRQTFGYPMSVAVSRLGSMFILDGENTRIVKVTNDRTVERTFGGVEGGRGRLASPVRLRTDVRDRVLVQDGERIVIFDDFGNYLASRPWNAIVSFAVDGETLYVLDSSSVCRIPPAGVVDTIIAFTTVASASPGEKVVDLAVRNGTVYLLRRHDVLVLPLTDERKKE